MAFQCSFAGVPFRLPTADVIAHVEKFGLLDMLDCELASDAGRSGLALALKIPQPYRPKLGEFWFPSGMSRCAIYQGLASGVDVAAMQAACLPTGGEFAGYNLGAAFVMQNDGLGGSQSLTYSMLMLPPRPLALVDSDAAGGLWLVTLVDNRYGSRFNLGDFGHVVTCSASTTTATWKDLLNWFTDNLFIASADLPTVPAVYGQPEPDSPLYGIGERFCTLLDAIAANIGGFVSPALPYGVAGTTGSFLFQTWQAAQAATLSARLASSQRVAGGALFNPDTTIADQARKLLLPPAIVVGFPKWISGAGYFNPEDYRSFYLNGNSYGDVFTVEVTAASLGSPYSTYAPTHTEIGTPYYCLYTTAKALYASEADAGDVPANNPTNYSAVLALAQQLAKDWYDQALLALDEVYQGIQPWPSNTGHDVLYVWNADVCFTRVRRKPFDTAQREFQHGFGPQVVPTPGLLATDAGLVSGLTPGSWTNVNSLSLPQAGTYLLAATTVARLKAATTGTELDINVGISLTSGGADIGMNSINALYASSPTTTDFEYGAAPVLRLVTITAPTTVYLVANPQASGATFFDAAIVESSLAAVYLPANGL